LQKVNDDISIYNVDEKNLYQRGNRKQKMTGQTMQWSNEEGKSISNMTYKA